MVISANPPTAGTGAKAYLKIDPNTSGIAEKLAKNRMSPPSTYTTDISGTEAFLVAAADNCMTRESLDLMAEVYPDVPIRGEVTGHQTLLSIDKARSLLGYEPKHSWRDYVSAS